MIRVTCYMIMFSGIVKSIGVVEEIHEKGGGRECLISPHFSHDWKVGESILVSGVCSTITDVAGGMIRCFYMPETLVKTTIGGWEKGTKVNIESSLRVGDEVSGHFVFGHVDGVATVRTIQAQGESNLFSLDVPSDISPYLAPKGSVALDGVSLTIVDADEQSCSVALIPFTLSHTTLGLQEAGRKVNIEIDMLARYVKRLALSV